MTPDVLYIDLSVKLVPNHKLLVNKTIATSLSVVTSQEEDLTIKQIAYYKAER